jgi:hypothetical protein
MVCGNIPMHLELSLADSLKSDIRYRKDSDEIRD